MTKFTTAEESILIGYVETNPCIWNFQHVLYKDVQVRDRIWSDIAQKMNRDVTSVKKKWIILRSQFLREVRREVNEASSTTGSHPPFKSKWHHYPQLLFLMETSEVPSPVTNITNAALDEPLKDEEESEFGSESYGFHESINAASADANRSTWSTATASDVDETWASAPISHSFAANRVTPAYDVVAKANESQSDDEFERKGKVIAADLRSLSRLDPLQADAAFLELVQIMTTHKRQAIMRQQTVTTTSVKRPKFQDATCLSNHH